LRKGRYPIVDYLWLIAGLAGLLVGGDMLVRGASGLARAFGVSPLVVGLTVVAFGTSAPELVVNVLGAVQGQTDLAFGNVVGSNLANLGLVLGIVALIAPVGVRGQIVRREIPLLALASAMLLVFSSDALLRSQPSALDRADGLGLLLLFLVFFYVTAGDVVRGQGQDPLLGGIDAVPRFQRRTLPSRNAAVLGAGLVLLFLGGRFTIEAGTALAADWGVSSTLIGLVLVAVGTSLPELVTSVLAAYRREPDLAVGNLVGSNLFNGLFVLPVSALITDVRIPDGGAADLLFSLALTVLLVPVALLGRGNISRRWGGGLLGLYGAYVAVRLLTDQGAGA
jgi:cation:H+ antiporter